MRFALRAARLFDGCNPHLRQNPLVVIQDGRISAIESGHVESPSDLDVVDLGDVTLMPGLIDVHVHLGFDAGLDPVARMKADDDPTLLLRMHTAAKRALAGGVTTVRDLGDRSYLAVTLRDWFREGPDLGPEIVAAGPPITVTGGHCHFMGGEADGVNEVQRAVRAHVKRGVDVIKLMATGGHMTPGTNPQLPQFSVEEVEAAVGEAHRLGRQLTAHAHGPAGIAVAVEASVDGLEHCSFRVLEGRAAEPELIDKIAAKQILVDPTVGFTPQAAEHPALIQFAESFVPILEDMHRAGVRLVAGTDAGISPFKPHDVLPYAVKVLSEVGLTNAEALSAATSVAAEACGLADRKGALQVGKDADILAVGGDPTVDMRTLMDVRAVFRGGRRV